MTIEEEQKYLDLITNETQKMVNLDKNLSIEIEEQEKIKNNLNKSLDQKSKGAPCVEFLDAQIEYQQELEEKKSLLLAVVNEAMAAGAPLTPSFVKLLNSLNGNFFL